ncbi:MAG: hypothetical protein JNG88_05905 [Phycisphaerales bacterium]|nr:hypothetical protein [Phycisphaerales bacterium]
MFRFSGSALIGLTVAILLIQTGCNKSSGGPTYTDKDFIGTWIEEVPQQLDDNNPRKRKIERIDPNLRLITVNADGTWAMALADTSGNAIAGGKQMEGKWTYDNGTFSFEVTKNGLGDKFAQWKPAGVTGFSPAQAGKGTAGVCTLVHENGEGATYNRKP